MKVVFSIVLLILGLNSLPAFAATYYVASQGDPLADGITAPTTLEHAVTLALQDGDIIQVLPGIHTVTSTLAIQHGITIEGVQGRPVSNIQCSAPVCVQVNTTSAVPVHLNRLFFTQTEQTTSIIDLANGDLNIAKSTFHQVQSAITDISVNYPNANAQLSVVETRFHRPRGHVIHINGGAYLKTVTQTKIIGSTSTVFALISYNGSQNASARANQYTTTLTNNLFLGSNDFGISITDLKGISRAFVENNRFENFQHSGGDVYAMAAIYSTNRIGNELYVRHNQFETIAGAAIRLTEGRNVPTTIEGNIINNVNLGIEVGAPYGNDVDRLAILNNLITRYRILDGDTGRGIALYGNFTPYEIYADIAYNTIVSNASEDDDLNYGGSTGAAISLNTSARLDVLVANNILHLEGVCQNRCGGIYIEDKLPIIQPIAINYGNNNIDGFTLDGLDGNVSVGSGMQIQRYAQDLGNTNLLPPFISPTQGNFDLSTSFPADPNLYSFTTDIDGNSRGVNPDMGAYQF